VPREIYSHWYNWSDLHILETLFRRCYGPDFLVVEVATGPNVAVPYALKRLAPSFRYVSLDVERNHVQLQKQGAGNTNVEGLVGDATQLPFRDRCVDTFVFHHAIDDIFETRCLEGVITSIQEALRTLKAGGSLIFSHNVFTYDPYTLKINLTYVQDFLQRRIKGRFQTIDGPKQRWLLIEDIYTCVRSKGSRRLRRST